MSQITLLDQLRSQLNIDVDSLDPDVAKKHTTETVRFCDMTSNQAIAYRQICRPVAEPVIEKAIAMAKEEEGDSPKVETVVDILTVLLAKDVYPYIKGRCLTQASPFNAHSTEKTVAHAKRLTELLEAQGIPRSRSCIKIASTPEALLACAELEKMGIRTLATCMMSLPQAMAAAQAGCYSVSPYLHELRMHFTPGMDKGYKDSVSELPMYSVIRDIINTYKSIGTETKTKPASVTCVAEVLALAELGSDSLTLNGGMLDQLVALPAEKPAKAAAKPVANEPKPHHPNVDLSSAPAKEPKAKTNGTTNGDATHSITSTDFLADNAAELRAALAADAEASRRLADALKIFGEMEEKSRAIVREHLKQ